MCTPMRCRGLPRVGEPAPDFSLQAVDGATIALGETAKPVVLVFMRHLA